MEHSATIRHRPSRLIAVMEGVLVTVIWASSFIMVKKVLDDLGPLTIAGLRYFLGFLFLLPFMVGRVRVMRAWSPKLWVRLFLIGLSSYTIGNGATFWSLKYLPATTTSFMMSLIPLLVLVAGVVWLREMPTRWQVGGMVVALLGGALFFYRGLGSMETFGLALVVIAMLSFAAFTILGRSVARDREVDTLFLTAVPLALGGGILLLIAFPLEGWPVLSPTALVIVLVMAIVNTALGYMLYNHALQTLTAFEMNVILNLMPLATAILAWLFLDERIEVIQMGGMITVIVGVALVQWGGSSSHFTLRG